MKEKTVILSSQTINVIKYYESNSIFFEKLSKEKSHNKLTIVPALKQEDTMDPYNH